MKRVTNLEFFCFVSFLLLVPASSQNVDYTDVDAKTDKNYQSETSYSAGGMDGYFKMSQSFVDDILKEIDPNDFVVVNEESHKISIVNLNMDTFKKYSGLITFWVFLIIFLILFPICGLIFVGLRCCGFCGAQPTFKNESLFSMGNIIKGVLLIFMIAALIFCMAGAFGSSEELVRGVKEFPNNVQKSIKDIGLFFNNTEQQLDTLLVTNLGEFKDKIQISVQDLTDDVITEIDAVDLAQTIAKMSDFIDKAETSKTNANAVNTAIEDAKTIFGQSQTELKNIKQCITDNCGGDNCDVINAAVAKLDTATPLPELDLTIITEELDKLNLKTISETMNQYKTTFDDLKTTIRKEVDVQMVNVNKTFADAQEIVTENLDTLKKSVEDFKSFTNEKTDSTVDDANDAIEDYVPSVHAVLTIFSCILLAIVILLIVGLVIGILLFKKDSGCLSKKTFFLCGAYLMFISAFFFAFLAIAASLTGILSEKIVCQPLRDINDSKFLDLLDKAVDLSKVTNATISTILLDCEKDKSIYQTFRLSEKFDLDEMIKKFNVDQTMTDLLNQLKEMIPTLDPGYILDETTKANLDKLVETVESFNFDFDDSLITNIASTMDDIIPLIEGHSELADCKTQCENYKNGLLMDLQEAAKKVTDSVKALQDALNLGQPSIGEAVRDIENELSGLETSTIGLTETLSESATNFTTTELDQVAAFIDRISSNIQTKIGTCKPLHNSLQNTLIATCDKVTQPLNGFWFGLFWALVFFIPAIILSVLLSRVKK